MVIIFEKDGGGTRGPRELATLFLDLHGGYTDVHFVIIELYLYILFIYLNDVKI